MVLRVRPTLTQFPTNILSTPVELASRDMALSSRPLMTPCLTHLVVDSSGLSYVSGFMADLCEYLPAH